MKTNLLTDTFSETLNGTANARVDINAGDGNLTIDGLNGNEQFLVSGTLQYFESQGLPTRNLELDNGQATFTLRGGSARRPWFRLPWSACNGATEWQIHLNPKVSSEITAHSDGGNVRLDLSGMDVTHLSADTGGGNMEVVLPDSAENLSVNTRTGAGNVTVELGNNITGSNILNANSGAGNVSVIIPGGVAACIRATTGLGKANIDSQFNKTGENTYQSADYELASNKVAITIHSGAGNVSVATR